MELVRWNVQVANQKKRLPYISRYFTRQDELCFCHNVTGLFEAIGIACNPSEWQFIQEPQSRAASWQEHVSISSPGSLGAAQRGIQQRQDLFFSFFMGGASGDLLPLRAMMARLKNVKILLYAFNYEKYSWEIIGDFKMVTFLMNLQGGFTKFPCYLRLRDSRNRAAHYNRRDWPQWDEFNVRRNSVKWEPLTFPLKVLFPSLHLKLSLMK